MAINEIYINGEKKVDLKSDTVTTAKLGNGITAHDKKGDKITGTMQGGLELNLEFSAGQKKIPYGIFYNNHGSGTTNSEYPIEEIIVGNNIKIDSGAFHYCTSLKKITILKGCTSIGNNTFRGCTSLTSITIPDSVTFIGSNAFSGCSSLTSLTIPSSVSTIYNNAFTQCNNLTTITVNKQQDSIKYAPWGATNATVVWTG